MIFKKKNSLLISAMLTVAAISGCSALDSFRKFQDDWIPTFDDELNAAKKSIEPRIEQMPLERVNAILDNQLVKDNSLDRAGILLNLYQYRSSDCNLMFEFTVEDKFSYLTKIEGDMVCTGGSLKMKDMLAAQAKQAENALPVGRCSTVINALDKYEANGGDKLSIDEIKAYIKKDKAEAIANATNKTIVLSDVKPNRDMVQASATLAGVNAQVETVKQKNTVNGKMRVCLISDPSVSGLVSGITEDGLLKLEKESDGTIINVSTDDVTLCQ